MSSKALEKLRKDDSFEDFEFCECEEDSEVDWPKSPLHEAADKITTGVSGVMSALSLIAEEQGLTVTIPVQAMAATAVGAITGSLLGGPSGLAIGFLTGAVIAYRTSPSKSTSSVSKSTFRASKSTVREIFSKMTLHQKRELIKELLSCLKQSNVRCLIYEILKNEGIRNMAMQIVSDYLKRKMGVGLVRSGK